MRAALLLLALLVPLPAAAGSVVAVYEVYAAGMTVLQVEARIAVDAIGYRMEARLRTRGVVAAIVPGENLSEASGSWAGALPAPRHYLSEGVWRGRPRRIAMEWQGGMPRLRLLEPPNEEEREPVPDALQRGTVDALSALAALSRAVQRGGGCEAAVPVYDGRRRVDYRAWGEGREVLRPWGRAWHGEATRCAYEGRPLAGFRRGEERRDSAAPQAGTAWMAAPFPGAPPIPVRVEIPNRWFGSATAVLLSAQLAEQAR